ncbi:MAG: 50S ribosome-binding GTPase, partial [Candidatus Izemoplasmatales bacterium]|nr:50S ribosome-binding GTPase [Candidatus Izemoplasmatales bacterium]
MLPKVAIVGRPNVGKSTIFNRIIGNRLAITDDTPGITRDRIYAKSEWYGRKFNVIDTGGIEISDAPFLAEIKAQVEIAIEESHVIIFVVDVHVGLINDDFEIMKLLFQSKKPVIIAVNKVDDLSLKEHIYDFFSLGADDVIAVSGIHGIGIGDLMEKILEYLPVEIPDEYSDDYLKLCIVGRPNVGKSSLTNAILGQER